VKAKAWAVAVILTGFGSVAGADRIAIVANPVGTPLGLGADLCYRVSDHFGVRVGGGLPATGTAKGVAFGEVEYDMTVKVGGVNAFAEWYPFGGNFRASVGMTTVRSPWSLVATTVSTYTLNGTSYPAADVGALEGGLRMEHSIAPALLLGWGNPVRRGKHWGLVLDLGVAYVGGEKLVLEADGPLASDPGFRRDLAAESARHSSSHSIWPVLKLGVSYQF
jgi:hypothetical protein